MAQLCLWTKIPTKKWLVLGALAFQYLSVGFLCPQCDNSACLHTHQDQNELHLKIWFFLTKSASSGIWSHAHLVKRKRIEWSIGFNSCIKWALYGIIRRFLYEGFYSSQWCLRNVYLLRTAVNWYWWRFMHTFCHSSNILGCTHCFLTFHALVYRWWWQFLSLFATT